jgi:alpha-tubulin suppressor-like RCC1 family protein
VSSVMDGNFTKRMQASHLGETGNTLGLWCKRAVLSLVSTLLICLSGLIPIGSFSAGKAQAAVLVDDYVPLQPSRILDTRSGVGAPQALLGAGGVIDLQVTGRGGVPTTGVTAVVLNVTAVAPSEGSYATVWPTGSARPDASNLNYAPGDVIPNLVMAKVGVGGKVSLFNFAGAVHLLADVSGYYRDGGAFVALQPARILDTRSGNGAPAGRVSAGGVVNLQVTGRGGVPASGVTAVVLNVTAVSPSEGSYATVWPTGSTQPNASNLNYVPGTVIPNLVIAKVGVGGQVSLFNFSGTVDLLADVAGYFITGGSYVPKDPIRILDTRTGTGAPAQKLGAGQLVDVSITGLVDIPSTKVSAVILNVTAVGASANSYLTVFPTGTVRPEASNLNFTTGQAIPNLVVAKLGDGGKLSFYNFTGEVDIIADVAGYIVGVTPQDTYSSRVMTSLYTACMVKDTGSLACWGRNAPQGSTWSGGASFGLAAVTPPASQPVPGPAIPDVVEGSGGVSHMCVRTSSGSVQCWGANGNGQLGNASVVSSNIPVSVQGITNASDVDAGWRHTCAIQNGKVLCWGSNYAGQLGNGTRTDSNIAVQVVGLNDAVQVSAGDRSSCAVRANGRVACWGFKLFGQNVYSPTPIYETTPVEITGVDAAAAATVGIEHACVVTRTGKLQCFGRNDSGQLGNGTATNSLVATDALVQNVRSASALDGATCAVVQSGSVFCSGLNQVGQLGQSTNIGRNIGALTPTLVPGLTNIRVVDGSALYMCGISSVGDVSCWGQNDSGQTGNGTAGFRSTPTSVAGMSNASQIAVSTSHTCAVTTTGGVECWGRNFFGSLGVSQSPTMVSGAPVSNPALTGFVEVGVGDGQTCGRTAGGTVSCWGYNLSGELGRGFTSASGPPLEVPGLIGVTRVSVGLSNTCVLVGAGSVKCWGGGGNGQLGNGSFSNSSSPVSVSGLSGSTAIAVGPYHACAVTSSTGVVCWGHNGSGQLGNGGTSSSAVPVAVAGLTGVTDVAVGAFASCALKSNGTGVCWGNGAYGALGNNSQNASLTPVPILDAASTPMANIAQIDMGYLGMCIRFTDATVLCRGVNYLGELGTGIVNGLGQSLGWTQTPVSPAGLAGVASISYNFNTICALLISGQAKCWGENWAGGLGIGNAFVSPNPTLVGSTSAFQAYESSALQTSAGGAQVPLPPSPEHASNDSERSVPV